MKLQWKPCFPTSTDVPIFTRGTSYFLTKVTNHIFRFRAQLRAHSLVPGCSGICFDCHQDLHGHGHTRNLCKSVGHGPGRRLQGEQVGDAVQHTAEEEDEEVKACHPQWRSSHGVDGTQEEKREDVLHVVNMSSIKKRRRRKQSVQEGWHLDSMVVWLRFLWCNKATQSFDFLYFSQGMYILDD